MWVLSKPSTRSNDNDLMAIEKYDKLWTDSVEKTFTFVWCDASIGTEINVEGENDTILRLASIVNKNGRILHTFNEINGCGNFIKLVDNVFLIVSGALGQQLVPLVHNLEQVHSIYVFCINKKKHSVWASHYRKIRGVYTSITPICESLKSCIVSYASYDWNRIVFDLISNDIQLPTADKHELSLIYSKLNRIILLNMDSSDHGKQDMINYCRTEFTTEYLTRLINDFEGHYSEFNPVWWYTKTNFFQGIINHALRSYDLYALCSMHRFIKDLDTKIVQLYEDQQTTTTTDQLLLYFGQSLSKYDFERLQQNRGGVICINQFISANPEQGIALMFINEQTSSTGDNVRILFQICIDQRSPPIVSYAKIGLNSEFVHENEYLISMFSVYRILAIERLVEIPSAWIVQLTLLNQNDVQYRNLVQPINNDLLEETTDLAELGYTIKRRLHEFKLSNKLFKKALDNKKEFRTIMLHYNMAFIYEALNKYKESLEEYRNALALARDFIPTCRQKDDICLISLYSNMGLTYQQLHRFNCALEHAYRALSIVSQVKGDSNLKKILESACYCTLGSIHDSEGKFSEARSFYSEALNIRKQYLPIGHSEITMLQRLLTLLSPDDDISY